MQNKGFDLDFTTKQARQSFFLFRSEVFHKYYRVRVLLRRLLIYKVMADKYITPEMETVEFTPIRLLCQSQTQSGNVEDVGRLEFDW